MRFLFVVFLVQSVITTATTPVTAVETTASMAAAIENIDPTTTASGMQYPSPLILYLGKVPGQEFAKRQIEFLKVSFEAIVTGSTGAEAERISNALEKVFKIMIYENAN